MEDILSECQNKALTIEIFLFYTTGCLRKLYAYMGWALGWKDGV